jgi:hypothetical protein
MKENAKWWIIIVDELMTNKPTCGEKLAVLASRRLVGANQYLEAALTRPAQRPMRRSSCSHMSRRIGAVVGTSPQRPTPATPQRSTPGGMRPHAKPGLLIEVSRRLVN